MRTLHRSGSPDLQPRRVATTVTSLAVVLLSLCTGAAHAQSSQSLIRGRLLDEQTRVPVRLAGVHLLHTDGSVLATVLTNEEGRFRIVVPTPGTYRLRGERLGYATSESPPITVASGETIDYLFHLAPGPVLLDSMLVTGRSNVRPLGVTEQLIHGRLLDDDTRQPIREGTVRLVDSNGFTVATTISDTLGLFRLVTPIPGDYRIRAERIGYASGETSKLHVMLKDTIRLDFFLDTDAVLLDPILVTASARPWSSRYELRGMEDFFRRMSSWRHSSFFLTRDTIHWYDRLGLSTSQMIRDATLRGSGGCTGGLAYWLDGNPLDLASLGISVDDLWPPAMLEAVEIHLAHPIPAELKTGFAKFPCTVVVLWTVREPKRRAR